MRVRNHDFESEERTWCLVSRTQILRWPGGRRESISTSPPLIRPLINLVRNKSYIMARVWLAVPTSSPSSLRRVERIARSLLSLISTTAPSTKPHHNRSGPRFLRPKSSMLTTLSKTQVARPRDDTFPEVLTLDCRASLAQSRWTDPFLLSSVPVPFQSDPFAIHLPSVTIHSRGKHPIWKRLDSFPSLRGKGPILLCSSFSVA